ncbi:MAG: hypothetical protein ACLR7U_01285 [Ruthenibacterium lactatiformans]
MMRNLLDANYRTYGVLVMELNTDTLFDSMRSVIDDGRYGLAGRRGVYRCGQRAGCGRAAREHPCGWPGRRARAGQLRRLGQ